MSPESALRPHPKAGQAELNGGAKKLKVESQTDEDGGKVSRDQSTASHAELPGEVCITQDADRHQSSAWRQHHNHLATFHLGFGFDLGNVFHLIAHAMQ